MKTLYFTQITDDRFEKDIRILLENRVREIKERLEISGISIVIHPIQEIEFPSQVIHHNDGSVAYITQANHQCRCRMEVQKTNKCVSWEDIYKIVNSVKPVRYSFY